MANPVWPASLPQNPYAEDDLNFAPEDDRISSEMDAGPPKERPRSSKVYEDVTFSMVLSRAQWITLDDFYHATLGRVGKFDWVDFRRDIAATYNFVGKPAASWYGGDGEFWKVRIHLRLWP